MKLLHGRVLLELEIEEEKTKGGIYLPAKGRVKTKVGKVLEYADDCEAVEVGDRVYFDEHAGISYTHEDKACVIVPEEDIIAYVVEE